MNKTESAAAPFTSHSLIRCGTAAPFADGQSAWIWAVQVQQRSQPPASELPARIWQTVDRLYRARCLLPDHLRVLYFYARRANPPDGHWRREARAAMLWQEAFCRITPALRAARLVD